MADTKISNLTELTTPAGENLLVIVDDPSGTPVTKKISLSNLVTTSFDVTQDSLFRQALINGNMDVWQRGTSFTSATTPANNDDTYLMDRWNLISDGNDAVDVSRDTDAPEGSKYSAKFDVETAKRFGIVQILEGLDTTKLKGKTVSLSFAVKSANISAIRAALLSWSGTEDTVTSDVVGTWAATPTWATNWTQENTPTDLTVTSSWTTVTINNIAIDSATVNNLALAIWTPNEETIGDIIYISQVQMNEGAVALPFQPRSFDEELRACQRYYQQSIANALLPFIGGSWTVADSVYVNVPLSTALFKTPSIISAPTRIQRAGSSSATDIYDGAITWSVHEYATGRTSVLLLGVPATTGTGKLPSFSVFRALGGVVLDAEL